MLISVKKQGNHDLKRCQIIHQRLSLRNKFTVKETEKSAQKKVEDTIKKVRKTTNKWFLIDKKQKVKENSLKIDNAKGQAKTKTT